jgi:DNA-binding MarR family transcriptional regulator
MKERHSPTRKHAGLESLRHTPGICSCQKLRSASRAVTRMYDEYLRPSGLTIGQYSILAALYYVPSMPLRRLAVRLELDRTTLTRSLGILERDGLVSIALDPGDSRVRSISITEAGLQKLTETYPLWMKAQKELSNALGARALGDFRESLDRSIEALGTFR